MAFNQAHADQELPYFGQELLAQAAAKGPLTDPAYRRALEKARRLSRRDGLDAVFARHRLDAILAPTGNPAWTIDLVNGDHFVMSSSTAARGGRLPRHHRAGRPGLGAAGGRDLHRPPLERGAAAPAGLCLRAGQPAAPAADGCCPPPTCRRR